MCMLCSVASHMVPHACYHRQARVMEDDTVVEMPKFTTLVRKPTVTTGNPDWDASSGTNADGSEWIVFDNETWDYLG